MPPEWKSRLSELPFDRRERDAIVEALESGWITAGPRTEQFEEAFSRIAGTSHAVAVSNGTAALFLALKAIGIGPGDEVICPSMTFVATAAAIAHCGATPVFADIVSLKTPTIDPDDVRSRVTQNTRAVLPVHYAGIPAEMDALLEISREHGLAVVEDAAHAPGASYKGRPVGSLGTAACFSLYGNKNITTGEGGVVTTDDRGLADRLRLLRSHGMTTSSWGRENGQGAAYDVVDVGYNFRFDDLRAAIGITQLKKLDAINHERKRISRLYDNRFSEGFSTAILPSAHIRSDRESACHIYPVVFPSAEHRSRAEMALAARGIQTSIHYPPVHQLSAFREESTYRGLHRSEAYGSRTLSLPLHPNLDPAAIDVIVDEVCRLAV